MKDINTADLRGKIIVQDSFESQGEGIKKQLFVVNPKLIFRATILPTNLSFCITMIVGNVKPGEHRIKAKIKYLENSVNVFESDVSTVSVPEKADDFTLNLDLRNIDLPGEGKFEIEFQVDENKFYEIFEVKKSG